MGYWAKNWYRAVARKVIGSNCLPGGIQMYVVSILWSNYVSCIIGNCYCTSCVYISSGRKFELMTCRAATLYTGKLCHRGKCHSGNCHSGERWMSRPFRPQWQFKFQAHFDKWFGLPQYLKTYHLSLYDIKKDMLLTGLFAMLSMPSFDFHLPPCTEGFLIHLSPLWQLPLWQLPLFPSVAQFPCVEKLKFLRLWGTSMYNFSRK